MHIPPREVIGIQIFANMLGLPVNCTSLPAQPSENQWTHPRSLLCADGVMRWIVDAKFDILTGLKPDPTNVWTAQDFKSYNTAGEFFRNFGSVRWQC